MLNYYQILQVDENAGKKEIQRQYRQLAREYHPDVSSEVNAKEKFQKITEAYEVLTDPQLRKKYDRKLKQHRKKNSKKSKTKSARKKQGRATFNPEEFKKQYKNSFRDFFGFDPDTKEKINEDENSKDNKSINTDDMFDNFFNPKN